MRSQGKRRKAKGERQKEKGKGRKAKVKRQKLKGEGRKLRPLLVGICNPDLLRSGFKIHNPWLPDYKSGRAEEKGKNLK